MPIDELAVLVVDDRVLEVEEAKGSGLSSCIVECALAGDLLPLEVLLELDDLTLPLEVGCAMMSAKQNTATKSSGAPIISPRVSSLRSIFKICWLKHPPVIFVRD